MTTSKAMFPPAEDAFDPESEDGDSAPSGTSPPSLSTMCAATDSCSCSERSSPFSTPSDVCNGAMPSLVDEEHWGWSRAHDDPNLRGFLFPDSSFDDATWMAGSVPTEAGALPAPKRLTALLDEEEAFAGESVFSSVSPVWNYWFWKWKMKQVTGASSGNPAR